MNESNEIDHFWLHVGRRSVWLGLVSELMRAIRNFGANFQSYFLRIWSWLFLDLLPWNRRRLSTLRCEKAFKKVQKAARAWWILMNFDEFDEYWRIYSSNLWKFIKKKKKFSTSRKVRKSDELWWNSSKFVKFLVTNHRFITKNDELMNLMNWLVMNKVYIRQWWIKFVTT